MRDRSPVPVVVLVNSDRDLRAVVRATLQDLLPCRVRTFARDAAAASWLAHRRPAAAILPYGPVPYRAPAVLAALRAQPHLTGLPVVFLHTVPPSDAPGELPWPARWMAMPFDVDDLVAHVGAVLSPPAA